MKKKIWNNKNGITSVLETMMALSITIVVLSLFFLYTSNLYTIYTDRPDIVLSDICTKISEELINSPGIGNRLNFDWDQDPNNISSLSLGATQLTDYGSAWVQFDDLENMGLESLGIYHGLSATCFLEGTRVLMDDGFYKNIEDVKINDYVKAFNIESGRIVKRRVTNVFYHTPEEMTDYYLVINNFLKVTPNHKIYNNGKWTFFGNIKVGDLVNNIAVYSVKRVYDQVSTFDLEIEKDHNYFVEIDNNNILAHNEDDLPTINREPWLTGKNIFPYREDFSSYGGDYWVDLTMDIDLSGSPSADFTYEVKSKTGFPYHVLDADKIRDLSAVNYSKVKPALGFNDAAYAAYNFNIKIQNSLGEITTFGASCDDTNAVRSSIARNILIYEKPKFISVDPPIVLPPYFLYGQITVQVFEGGTLPEESPNNSPEEPDTPEPTDGATGVPIALGSGRLEWECSDPDGDPLTYNLYFGKSASPPLKAIGLTDSYYEFSDLEGPLDTGTPYYWKVVAIDSHNAETEGDVWVFTTAGAPSNTPPVVDDIPDQTITSGESFATIALDNYVYDAQDDDWDITWTYSGDTDLSVSIDVNRIATVTPIVAAWTGSETITFRATDTGGLFDEDPATFTVTVANTPPVVDDIPDQTIVVGESFATIDLDENVSDAQDPDWLITWTYSGDTDLSVSIDVNRIATVTPIVAAWTGSETITFRATDTGGLFDEDSATFTVVANTPPVVDDIPDQTIVVGESFATIDLNTNVTDVEDPPSAIDWTYSGDVSLTVVIAANTHIATITPKVAAWTGSETITFIATDTGGLSDDDDATFTVNSK